MASSNKTADNLICGGGGMDLHGRDPAGDVVIEADELELAVFEMRHGVCWVNIAANQLESVMYAPVQNTTDGSFEVIAQFTKSFPRQ